MLRWSGWLVVATLAVAAAYELVLALLRTPSPSAGGALLVVGLLAMLLAGGLVFARLRVPAAGLFAPAAALFVTARFYTGDPYYGPTFRAYADGGIFPPAWIFVLLGVALLAGVTTQLWQRTEPVENALVLVLLMFTALYMGTGH